VPDEDPAMRTAQRFLLISFILGLALQAPLVTSARAEDLVDFTLNDFATRKQVNTKAFRGKVMLIIFGSIYCKPCVKMLPIVRQLRDKYEKSGLIVVGIDIDATSEEEKITQFIRHHEIRHLYLIDTVRVARMNKVFTLPTTLIVNRKGGIEKRLLGFYNYEKLEKIVKKVIVDIQP